MDLTASPCYTTDTNKHDFSTNRERERDREKDRDRDTETETERDRDREADYTPITRHPNRHPPRQACNMWLTQSLAYVGNRNVQTRRARLEQ